MTGDDVLIIMCAMGFAFLAGFMCGNRQVRRWWRLQERLIDRDRERTP